MAVTEGTVCYNRVQNLRDLTSLRNCTVFIVQYCVSITCGVYSLDEPGSAVVVFIAL